jgi:hypothetical protein
MRRFAGGSASGSDVSGRCQGPAPAGVVLVAGTWGDRGSSTAGEWWQGGSAFVAFLEASGVPVLSAAEPFRWSTRLGGLPGRWRLTDWEVAGWNLRQYCRATGARRLVTHSHGLQPALCAAAAGLELDVLVSVAGPPRGDMAAIAVAARPRIRTWVQVIAAGADWADWTAVGGTLFDSVLDLVNVERRAIWYAGRGRDRRVLVAADSTIEIPKVGHSRLVRDPAVFECWRRYGLIDVLKGSGETGWI